MLMIDRSGDDGLTMYDPRHDRAHVLARASRYHFEKARFRDPTRVTFEIQARNHFAVCQLDLSTRDVSTVVTGTFAAYAWDPSGSRMGFVDIDIDTNQTFVGLREVGGSVRRLASLGRWTGNHDLPAAADSHLEWSPDGSAILVSVTDAGEIEQVHVFDPMGRKLLPSRAGTLARWLPDGRFIYRQFRGDERWFVVDVRTGGRARLDMRRGTTHPAVSPDGTRIGYDDARKRRLFVYNVETGEERLIANGYVAPAWVTSDTLLATRVEPCDPPECLGDWDSLGRTARISLNGERERGAPSESFVDDVLYG